ncbi:mannosyl-oligosaccharide glucosidase [Klebsormidium nitens]|uniref:Mannosyl-oligosaccharide glucosidase n=1 Tax=Klebsormidium nitens TaxID=105231 RepID=A0A1Y1INL2_KLENI|nr:mannosyl-oligosaccharide glucosidase [Klebsormidium nitens]|eukprot:GAQ91059.1 mannosyl-oligosaccharide glucosidase [Klebsormidium nitens]
MGKSSKRLPPRDRKKQTADASAMTGFLKYALVAGLAVMAAFSFQLFTEDAEVRALKRSVAPLQSPKVTELDYFQEGYKDEMLWGTYRPGMYLGIRARVPKSIIAGLMWLGISKQMYRTRHECEDSDEMSGYGWLRHDGVRFGRQELLDEGYLITTSFMKDPEDRGAFGEWAVRVTYDRNKDYIDIRGEQSHFNQGSFLFYIMDETEAPLEISPDFSSHDRPFASGKHAQLGRWEFRTRQNTNGEVHFHGARAKPEDDLTKIVRDNVGKQVISQNKMILDDVIEPGSNMAVFQVTGTVPLEVDFFFTSPGGGGTETEAASIPGKKRLTKRLQKAEAAFDERFEETFRLRENGASEGDIEVAKHALSNMLGGMGYFYGRSRIAISDALKERLKVPYYKYWPAALFTATPSRSFFPRGFLWDEGFHQLLIGRWDRRLTLDVMAHWLDLMNKDGWIPREQILGSEARRRVPDQFVLQHTTNANPPTLFMPLREIAMRIAAASSDAAADVSDDERALLAAEKAFLVRSYPRLKVWFNWFNTTQVGKLPGSYYWHGRDATTDRELNPKTLTSGLDDYPRASHPSDDERHVDLRCWMALAAESMALIGRILGEPADVYEETAEHLSDFSLLNQLHLDEKSGNYYDFGNHTEKVELVPSPVTDPSTGHMYGRQFVRVTHGKPRPRFVPHYGYNSLFPLLMRLIPPDSPILETQIDKLTDQHFLWTPFGLRSLARSSSMYMKHNTEHDAPYWRGPVWINLNYLALAALRHYGDAPGPYRERAREVHAELRRNLVGNIVDQYYKSGYIWEQYKDSDEGDGTGSHPFTGWSALVVLMMADQA